MSRKTIVICILVVCIIATVAFIFRNSLDSGEESYEKSDVVTEVVKPIVEKITTSESILDHISALVRKAAHFFEFMMLGIESYILAVLLTKRAIGIFCFVPLFGVLMTAVIDEFIQSFNSRTSSVKDVLIDFSGAVFGMALSLLVCSIIRLVKQKKAQKKALCEETR